MHQPACCSQCKATDFLNKGVGTQQLVQIVEKLFPTARIGRADLDITAKKKSWQETLASFEQGTLDILVGTQTITKGFHFPNVTLVGIIWADLNLHFPVYNATENALQQLIQVAGRAGRLHKDSLVIVQTMSEHAVLNFMNELSYISFYDQEIALRQEVGYPPALRLVEIELKYNNEQIIEKEATHLMTILLELIEKNNFAITALGPAKPPVHMIKNVYMRKIYLKSAEMNRLIQLFQMINKDYYASQIYFTPNPLH